MTRGEYFKHVDELGQLACDWMEVIFRTASVFLAWVLVVLLIIVFCGYFIFMLVKIYKFCPRLRLTRRDNNAN